MSKTDSAQYFISTYYDDFYIVNPDGSYVMMTPACDYRTTRYDWKIISKKGWWQRFTKQVTKEQFYERYDLAIRKRSGLI